MKRTAPLILIFIHLHIAFFAQSQPKNYTVNGHLQDMQMLWIKNGDKKLRSMNILSNRIDFRWHPSNNLKFHAGMRNNVNYGQLPYELYPYLANMALQDNGKLDLSRSLAKDSSYYVYTNLDRAYFSYTHGKLEIDLGRQRINWSINFLWTPNDIFNSFNYFDFDYVERPGCDALRIQYFTGASSSVQLACKIDKQDRATYAAMYNFTKWNYDFQFLSGLLHDDFVIGAGWAGQIKGAGFTGEASFFRDIKNNKPSAKQVFVASTTLNYTFRNGFFMQTAFLYNSAGTTQLAGQGNIFALNLEISAKNFTRAKYSGFAQASYPLTPLIKADLSGIYNPSDKSSYIGPSLDISLSENTGLLLTSQFFFGKKGSEFGDYGSLMFARLKWVF